MLPTSHRIVLLGAAALLWSACNAYDPSLGQRPFRCGATEPRCPDDYECISYGPGQDFCESPSAGPIPDGGITGDTGGEPFMCSDDSEIEINDTLAEATPTPVDGQADTYRLVGLSICPDTDIDLFKINIGTALTNVRVDVTHAAVNGNLILELLEEAGNSVETGEVQAADPDLIRLEVPNLSAGDYYVSVRAPAGVRNNYSIDIVTTQ